VLRYRRLVCGIEGVAAGQQGHSDPRSADERTASSHLDPAAHEFAMTKIYPRLGEADTTEALLALLR